MLDGRARGRGATLEGELGCGQPTPKTRSDAAGGGKRGPGMERAQYRAILRIVDTSSGKSAALEKRDEERRERDRVRQR